MTAADDPRDGRQPVNIPIPDPSNLTTAQLHREIAALDKELTVRMDAMDRAYQLAAENLQRTPTEIQKQIAHLKDLCWERFESIGLQFAARDDKVEALAITAAASLKSALEAAAKLSEAQNDAAKLANQKTEVAFGEQIKALSDKIEVNTRALDRGEGSTSGAAGYRTEHRLDLGTVIATIAVIVAVVSVIVVAFKH